MHGEPITRKHLESPLMLGDRADLWGPSGCIWGMVHLGHFPPPTDKNKAYACRRGHRARNPERHASRGTLTSTGGGTDHNLA